MGKRVRYLGMLVLSAAFLVTLAAPFCIASAEGLLRPNQEGVFAFKGMVDSDPDLREILLHGTKNDILVVIYANFDLSNRPLVQKRLQEMPEEQLKGIAARFVAAQSPQAIRVQSRQFFGPAGRNG